MRSVCHADGKRTGCRKILAGLVSDEELTAEYILPAAFDARIADTVAKAVIEAARKSGAARL